VSDYDFSALRYLTQAGGAMSPALTLRLREAFSTQQIFVMYGQTEATSRISYLPPGLLEQKIGSVGRPIDGVEWQVRAEDGRPCATGCSGTVWVRGPNVMLGYWRNPEATAAVLQDGWLCTGDVGRLDEDGFLFLEGRRNDIIKVGAHRVHPQDVEHVVGELDGVEEVAAVGVDEELLGEVIKVCVVVRSGVALSEQQVRRHCLARLPAYKVPRHVEFVAALPKTTSGKLRRVALINRMES
jgi:long-chain acyl-CoA synthetase